MTKTKINPLKIYSLEEVEEDLKTLKPIKFKTKDFNPKNINAVLHNLVHGNAATYHVHNNNPQCSGGRYRGIADIYRLCRHYFPNCTLSEVIKAFKDVGTDITFCHETNQTVLRNTKGNTRSISLPLRVRLSNRKAVRID